MKIKKPKRRFLTANEIRDEIDKYKAKALKFQQQADALEIASRELAKSGLLVEDAKYRNTQALRARRSASRILDKKLPKLKEKLAEFLTPNLPGSGIEDRSVNA